MAYLRETWGVKNPLAGDRKLFLSHIILLAHLMFSEQFYKWILLMLVLQNTLYVDFMSITYFQHEKYSRQAKKVVTTFTFWEHFRTGTFSKPHLPRILATPLMIETCRIKVKWWVDILLLYSSHFSLIPVIPETSATLKLSWFCAMSCVNRFILLQNSVGLLIN